jgi:hypothetical protein
MFPNTGTSGRKPAIPTAQALSGATVSCRLERMLPKMIHAVTAEGFELRVFLFVLAYSINCLRAYGRQLALSYAQKCNGAWKACLSQTGPSRIATSKFGK